MADQTFRKDNEYITLRGNIFTRDGYQFAGWSDTSSVSSAKYKGLQPVKIEGLFGDGMTENLTLYAVWKISKSEKTSSASGSAVFNAEEAKANIDVLKFSLFKALDGDGNNIGDTVDLVVTNNNVYPAEIDFAIRYVNESGELLSSDTVYLRMIGSGETKLVSSYAQSATIQSSEKISYTMDVSEPDLSDEDRTKFDTSDIKVEKTAETGTSITYKLTNTGGTRRTIGRNQTHAERMGKIRGR